MNGYLNNETLMHSTRYCYTIRSYDNPKNDGQKLKNSLKGSGNWHLYGCSLIRRRIFKNYKYTKCSNTLRSGIDAKNYLSYYKEI